jgi:hypothetical protein
MWKTNVRALVLSASPQASKFRVRTYRAEFSHSLGPRVGELSDAIGRQQRGVHERAANVAATAALEEVNRNRKQACQEGEN